MTAAAKRSRFTGFIYVVSTLKVAPRLRSLLPRLFSHVHRHPPREGSGCTLPQEKASGKRFRTAVRAPRDVRFGSFCDISAALADVRFMPQSGRITRRQLTST